MDRADRHEALKGDPIYQAIDRGGGQTCDVLGVMDALGAAGYKVVKVGDPIRIYDIENDTMRPITQVDVDQLQAATQAFGQLRQVLRLITTKDTMTAEELRALLLTLCVMPLERHWLKEYTAYLHNLRGKLDPTIQGNIKSHEART